MDISKIRKATLMLLFGVALSVVLEPASAITPAQTPLYIGISAAKPNIMLMVDSSGSMTENVMTASTTTTPNDAPLSYSYSCPSANELSGGVAPPATPSTMINMKVNSSGTVQVCTKSSCSKTATFGGKKKGKCFNNTQNYTVAYYNGSSLAGGPHTGLKLNWYFSTGNFASGSLTATQTTTSNRTTIAKQAATDLVTSLTPDSGGQTTVRMGLARYDGATDDGGMLLSEIKDLDSAHSTALLDQISNIPASGYTPLAETLSDIGKYFATGETGNLTLHPATTKVTASAASIFSKADGTSRSIKNSTGNASLAAPILGYCQKSFVILVSDGLPTRDTEISSYLRNYTNGGEYLDDVAQALYEMDLRPSLDSTLKANTHTKNNVTTYAIGFADSSLNNTTSVLSNAAKVGGGKFYFAENANELASALDDTISDISSKIGSSSSVVANAAKLDANAAIYQGKFDSADWTGSLSMFPLGITEDTNGNGILDTGEDTNSNGKLDGGAIGTALWNAAEHIPAFDSRNIFTYDPAGTPKGITFVCANLTAGQKTALGISNCSSTTDQGVWRLNYIRGDWSHEEKNPARTDTDTIRSATAADWVFRNRTHLDKTTLAKVAPDPWVLGDIVNSNPAYVSAENYGYDKLSGSEGSTYKAFVTSNATRRKMIYVGANDGMLHGFDASASGTDAGKEILAYIPNAVYSGLSALSSPGYSHQYLVDGSSRVADAYFGSAWHTMLVSSTGAGGKAVFGLDVTNPGSFGSSNVLWEISDTDSPAASDLTSDTTATRGFANNLGYTLPQTAIVKMHDGSWAAIVANGYGSVNNLAVLYIIDVQTGQLIAAIDTKAGSSTTPNGLSSPIPVDTNNDRIVDSIYAGDLLGNMWKFDVSSSNTNQWKVAYGTAAVPAPLYIACTNTSACDTTRQPITAKPQVGKVGTGQSAGIMVYFGTGKYFEATDNDVTNAQTQTFYGIWDNGAAVAKSDLQAQTITQVVTSSGYSLRISSNNTMNYPSQKGWYINLPSAGERAVSAPLIRNGHIIFTTLIPIPPAGTEVCGAGSEATSMLMELDALTGSRLPDTAGGAPWDITGDGMINADDLIELPDGTHVAPSGIQLDGGAGTPAVVSDGKREDKIFSISKNAGLQSIKEQGSSSSSGGRESWRQLQ
ncbi:PilC-like protein with beta-propeller domain [Methylobacter tundripaludum]|uniref:PilC-like protein with beta-propeller domain n=1 Tax=Methylobacter tundripaludum TaxID=173365 RepID=A0A2S6HKC9_9GAMM|nr:PilC/PilY family type IV pilus protein [Methylobacter tundripaludum]PPK77939.1 PilC-like protein with beta-propeller domain [Methylobacter tundripaludum]